MVLIIIIIIIISMTYYGAPQPVLGSASQHKLKLKKKHKIHLKI